MEDFLADASEEEEESENSEESLKETNAGVEEVRPTPVVQKLEEYDAISENEDSEPSDDPADRPQMLTVQKLASFEEESEDSESEDFGDVLIPVSATRKLPTPK